MSGTKARRAGSSELYRSDGNVVVLVLQLGDRSIINDGHRRGAGLLGEQGTQSSIPRRLSA
jgi:hypothetical protein